jgi:hypothetical protein
MSEVMFKRYAMQAIFNNNFATLATLNQRGYLKRAYDEGLLPLVFAFRTPIIRGSYGWKTERRALNMLMYMIDTDSDYMLRINKREIAYSALQLSIELKYHDCMQYLLACGATPDDVCIRIALTNVNMHAIMACFNTGFQLSQWQVNELAVWTIGNRTYSDAGVEMARFILSLRPQIDMNGSCSQISIEAPIDRGGIMSVMLKFSHNFHTPLTPQWHVVEMIMAVNRLVDINPLLTPHPRDRIRTLREFDICLFKHFSVRATEICIALQNLRFPALVTIEILDSACVFALDLPYHLKWALATKVKHFK